MASAKDVNEYAKIFHEFLKRFLKKKKIKSIVLLFKKLNNYLIFYFYSFNRPNIPKEYQVYLLVELNLTVN